MACLPPVLPIIAGKRDLGWGSALAPPFGRMFSSWDDGRSMLGFGGGMVAQLLVERTAATRTMSQKSSSLPRRRASRLGEEALLH